jgi:hypothetical protein
MKIPSGNFFSDRILFVMSISDLEQAQRFWINQYTIHNKPLGKG